jgi:hypothetical protein
MKDNYLKPFLEKESLILGDYHVSGLKEFNEGQLVKIYEHSYIRLITFDKNQRLYIINNTQINKNFIRKDDWRAIQISKLIE